MNSVTDDYGYQVPAVGAPGSMERVRIQYPKLLGELLRLKANNFMCSKESILSYMKDAGIVSQLEIKSVLTILGLEHETNDCSNRRGNGPL